MNKKTVAVVILITIVVILVISSIITVLLTATGTEFQFGTASVVACVGVICAALLSALKPEKTAKSPKTPKIEPKEKIRDREKLNAIIWALKERTETEYYKISMAQEATDIYSSKLGGLPYWDLNRQYPTDANGKKLVLLAQINFEKENFDDERLPKTGILQFFIGDDDWLGCTFRPLCNDMHDSNFVVYHETITENLSEEDIIKLDIPTYKTAECSPIDKHVEPMALKFEKSVGYISIGDYRFDGLFKSILKEKYGEDISNNEPWYWLLNEAEFDCIRDALDTWEHKMLGYPNFVQWDVRNEGSPYDTLLLEINSDDMIMWGDAGVANFLINSDSLKNKDFSKVAYTWDCS